MRYIILLFLGTFLIAFRDGQTPAKAKPVKPRVQQLQFRYDKRVETFYIVMMLTGEYDVLISRHPSTYKSAALKQFKPYKDHKAVEMAKYLALQGFGADYPVNWLFQYSDFPDFRKSNEVDFPFEGRFNADTLNLFAEELAAFYKDSHCDSFFAGQEGFFREMIEKCENAIPGKDLPSVLEAYYGIEKHANFYMVLSPLMHSGGFEIDCHNTAEKKLELYALVGPNGEIGFTPVFDRTFLEQDIVIHEFGHSYANPIVDEYKQALDSYTARLFNPVRESLENEGVVEESFMYELVVRAVTVRIVEKTYGKPAATELLDYEQSIGFHYVAEIADELKMYESNRKKYPILKAFFPQIIRRLGKFKPSPDLNSVKE